MRALLRRLKRLIRREKPAPPEKKSRAMWQLGIMRGSSPLTLAEDPTIPNPVFTRAMVTDVPCGFVADPFLVRQGDRWHLFFELLNLASQRGEIGLATSSDLASWQYDGIVLKEPFHLSYPQVFEWQGTWYMVPETHKAKEVRIYQADSFPNRWTYKATLLSGLPFSDATVFRHQERWWLFVEGGEQVKHDTLRLYHSDNLLDGWSEHPMSPIVSGNPSTARPAGSVVHVGDQLIRFAQDCKNRYGESVRAFEITTLTPTEYIETPLSSAPVYGPAGAGWNAAFMHHVDAREVAPGQWLASVDGAYAVTPSELWSGGR